MEVGTIALMFGMVALAGSATALWLANKARTDGLSWQDEFATTFHGILGRHLNEAVTASVAAVKAVQATPAAPAPVAPAVWPAAPLVGPDLAVYVPPIVPVSPIQAPISTFLGPQPAGTAPYVAPVRDEMTEGPKIAEFVSGTHPELMPKASRIIHWWATHAGATYGDAIGAILVDKDLKGNDLANAIGQQHRDEAAHVEGDLYNGPYPVGSVSLTDMYYLLGMKPRYAAMTGRNVLIDVLYGSADKVNELINDAGSTHAAEMAQFNVDAYQGPLRPIVESRMNGR